MCGIVGYWTQSGAVDLALAARMASQIQHRGPDDAGFWKDESAGLVMAHRRLAIVDLSPAGHQPMSSPCGRWVLVFNGEIYNHQDLRKELDAHGAGFDWRGHSDTETLLATICHWGLPGALERINGMFAFALWDVQDRILALVRDRMGEKPLYYGNCGGTFLFGSELKALEVHPDWQGKVDRNALASFLRHGYVPAPYSIYHGVDKLPPAHFVMIREGNMVGEPCCYWDLKAVAGRGVGVGAGEPETLITELDELLSDAVGRRMVADVPLGAFLSGGYDSTTIVALMQAQSMRPVKTFSIGFHETEYNEAQHAVAVAQYLGTDHTEFYVDARAALAVIPKLPFIYDEPFADASQIPTYLLSELARKEVTVSLSGDGGDELFYGYERYFIADRIWGNLGRIPSPVRRAVGAILHRVPERALAATMAFAPARLQIRNLQDRLPALADIVAGADSQTFYRELVSHWKSPERIVIGGREPATLLSDSVAMPSLPTLRERMMYLDAVSYLPDDILVKVDRASMAVGLEARVPLLDHRVVEFAWRIPTDYKFRDGQGKWLLRRLLDRYVPNELMNRPKMGFGVPIDVWLRGPLREWAEDLLNEERLRGEGFFRPEPIRQMWLEHISGARNWQYYLWDVLMFQAWIETKSRSQAA